MVDDRGASYPLRIDPFVQRAELTATDAAVGGELGFAVAVSGDTIAVGAPYHKVGPNSMQGAVYVFVEPASGWANGTQTAELTAADGASNDQLGLSVAASGSTIVAGAPLHTLGPNNLQGAAYVFVEPVAGWANGTQTAEVTASDGAQNDELGISVAVSGGTVVVGAAHRTIGPNTQQGAVHVFTEPASGWSNNTQAAELTAADGRAFDELGYSVAISGGTLVAGSPVRTVGANHAQGTVYVFTEPASGWGNNTQTAELTATDGAANDELGWSVAASGGTIVAGVDGHNNFQGAAYVFEESPAGWANGTQTSELTASDCHKRRSGPVGGDVGRHDRRRLARPLESARRGVCICQLNAERQRRLADERRQLLAGTDGEGVVLVLGIGTSDDFDLCGLRPMLSAFKQSHRRWREGKARPAISAAARRRRPPIGTTFSFSLSEPATVTLVFTKSVKGHKVNTRRRTVCKANGSRTKHKPACRLTIVAGRFSLPGPGGRDRVAFKGRLVSRRKLAPGTYTVTITATANGRASRPQKLTFTIV